LPAPDEAAPVSPSESAPVAPDLDSTPPESDEAVPAPGDEPVPTPGDEPPDQMDNEMPAPSPAPAIYVPGGGQTFLRTIQFTADGSLTVPRRADPASREEIARILTANMVALDKMPGEDRRYIEETIAAQTGISTTDARRRLDGLLARIKTERNKAAETARKAAAYIHIWMGLALFFGLLVATGAAVLARLENEDKGTGARVVVDNRTEPAVSA
jgi:hypothetical protein